MESISKVGACYFYKVERAVRFNMPASIVDLFPIPSRSKSLEKYMRAWHTKKVRHQTEQKMHIE